MGANKNTTNKKKMSSDSKRQSASRRISRRSRQEETRNAIFVSYSRKDKVFARFLANRLRKEGAKVWVDEGELNIGQSLWSTIAQTVGRVRFVVAIISRNSIRSRWVRKELALAMHREITSSKDAFVIPILIDDARMPIALSDKLFCDLSVKSPDWEFQFFMLLRALGLRRIQRKPHGTTGRVCLPLGITLKAALRNCRIVENDCNSLEGLYPLEHWTGTLMIPRRYRTVGRTLSEQTTTQDGKEPRCRYAYR